MDFVASAWIEDSVPGWCLSTLMVAGLRGENWTMSKLMSLISVSSNLQALAACSPPLRYSVLAVVLVSSSSLSLLSFSKESSSSSCGSS